MTFQDKQFPLDIGYDSQADPAWFTNILRADSGRVERVGRWSRPKRTYDISFGIRNYVDGVQTGILTVRDFKNVMGGPRDSFRFRDPTDYSTLATAAPDKFNKAASLHTNADVLIGTGDATTVNFQLRKGYTYSGSTFYLACNKIVAGTLKVALDGVNQTSGFTYNLVTGVLTFTAAPGLGVVITAGFEFDVEVFFQSDNLPMIAAYFSSGKLPPVILEEVIDGSTVVEDWPGCGGGRKSFSGNITIAQSEGRLWELTPASGSLTVTVEDASAMQSGGVPHYSFFNASAHSLTLKGGATTIGTLAAGADTALRIWKVGGTKTWKGTTP